MRKARDGCRLRYDLHFNAATGAVTGLTVGSGGAAAPEGAGPCSAPLLTAAGAAAVEVPAGGSVSVAAPKGLRWTAVAA